MKKGKSILCISLIFLVTAFNAKTQPIDINGTWHGKLFQENAGYNIMTVILNQTKDKFYGLVKNDFKNQNGEYVIYNIEGEINGTKVKWIDISIQSENSIFLKWCKKIVTARIIVTADSMVLTGTWSNDSLKYFIKKELKEGNQFSCYPGTFRVVKKNEIKNLKGKETESISTNSNKLEKNVDNVFEHIVSYKPSDSIIHSDKKTTLLEIFHNRKDQSDIDNYSEPKTQRSTINGSQVIYKSPEPKNQNTEKYDEPINKTLIIDSNQQVYEIPELNINSQPYIEYHDAKNTKSSIKISNVTTDDKVPEIEGQKSNHVLQSDLKRRKTLIQNILEVTSDSLVLLFFDNGIVDNDTISVYYNKTLILDHKRLSSTPIRISIRISPETENELVMYANNLGEIVPNTAVLQFDDNQIKRNVYIKSDTQTSGAIIFRRAK